MTLSKEEFLAQLQPDSAEYQAFSAILLESNDVLAVLWGGLIGYYKAQIEKNKSLPQGETIQSVLAPTSQQQADGKGGFYMVKSISVRVKSPVSEEVLPFLS